MPFFDVLIDALMARMVHLRRASPKVSSALLSSTYALSAQILDFYPGSPHFSPAPSLDPRADAPLTCSVGQDQQQAVRPHLRLGQKQGAHPSPSLSLLLLTQDLGQFLFIILLKILLGRQKKTVSGR